MRISGLAVVFMLALAAALSFAGSTQAAPQSGSVTISPTSFNFGSVTVGGGENSTQFLLTNGTASDITITGVAITPQFGKLHRNHRLPVGPTIAATVRRLRELPACKCWSEKLLAYGFDERWHTDSPSYRHWRAFSDGVQPNVASIRKCGRRRVVYED